MSNKLLILRDLTRSLYGMFLLHLPCIACKCSIRNIIKFILIYKFFLIGSVLENENFLVKIYLEKKNSLSRMWSPWGILPLISEKTKWRISHLISPIIISLIPSSVFIFYSWKIIGLFSWGLERWLSRRSSAKSSI